MKALVLLAILATANAQKISEDPSRPSFGKEGQIFTLKITPKDKKLEIRFVDSPMMTLEPERLTVTAKIQNQASGFEEVKVEEKGNEIRLSKPLDERKTYEFKILDEVTKKSEVIRIEPRR